MLERIARAIGEARCHATGGTMPLLPSDTLYARAAVEALREPTKEMIFNGNSKIDDCIDFYNYDSGSGYTVEPHAARETWSAMIDAILEERGSK